ncbi:hypothetical protein MNBD_IGNAVI01-325 [hydrothermal vent metagenome]|uniref:SGNH hydrolase-type esterase domain-containing protein n=1 Tax=hydrothermal vent metagenome TaxID=652676 RepID=A0A3B1DBN7_9ZZZZ
MKKILSIVLVFVFLFNVSVFAQKNGSSKKQFKIHYYTKKSIYDALPNTKDEILFVGNSITASGQWTEMFQDLRVKNRGISGDVTDGLLYRLKEVTESQPSKIFLMIGVNDLSREKSKSYILKRYQEILDSIRSQTPSTKIYIQSILPVNDKFGYFKNHTNKTDSIISINRDLEIIAEKIGAKYIDLFSAFADPQNKMKEEYTLDGLHPNGKGYLKWVELIRKYVE